MNDAHFDILIDGLQRLSKAVHRMTFQSQHAACPMDYLISLAIDALIESRAQPKEKPAPAPIYKMAPKDEHLDLLHEKIANSHEQLSERLDKLDAEAERLHRILGEPGNEIGNELRFQRLGRIEDDNRRLNSQLANLGQQLQRSIERINNLENILGKPGLTNKQTPSDAIQQHEKRQR